MAVPWVFLYLARNCFGRNQNIANGLGRTMIQSSRKRREACCRQFHAFFSTVQFCLPDGV
jgi:hypothetical protein